MRAACACGWYGEATYLIDWDLAGRYEAHEYDTSGPLEDWAEHARETGADRCLQSPYFARAATGTFTWEEIARSLVSTGKALDDRLRRYDRRRY
ncbi:MULTISPECIES: hypothetical protein [unclassified Streptomyces]|uniref:hypothetical protein n=1 Tax=unclassified Streptomyces TaxID=2593676 RepID=UPI0006AD8CDF|nr:MULTISPECIES: hypothetical protein [unclassified Streptomyces]